MIKCVMDINLSTNKSGSNAGGPRIGGWSESWYHVGPIEPARIAFQNICIARAGLLPNSGAIVKQRYTIIGGGTASTKLRYVGPVGRKCGMPQKSLGCTARVGDMPNVRAFALRGLPDIWVDEGELSLVDGFVPAWNAYKTAVQVAGNAFRGQKLTNDSVGVASVTTLGEVTFQAPLILVEGDWLQLRDIHDQFRVSRGGRYQVTAAPDFRHATVRGWPAGSTVSLNGLARKYEIVFPTTNMFLDYDKVVNRKVGRPSGQYRGRGSKRP